MPQVLRDYDEALAAAGDARGALALFHRERLLSADVMRQNRDAALKQLRLRNDRERQQRDIELLERDNQLKAAALANRALMQRVWAVATLALLLSAVVVACCCTGACAAPSGARLQPGPAARAERARPAHQPGQPATLPVGDADRARAGRGRTRLRRRAAAGGHRPLQARQRRPRPCRRRPGAVRGGAAARTRRCAATTWWCAGAARSSWCWRCRCRPSRWRCWPSACCASSASRRCWCRGSRCG